MEKYDNNEHIQLIKKVEVYFAEHYDDITAEWGDDKQFVHFKICCSRNERIKILAFGYIIRHNPAYHDLRLVDIFIVLIYIYYSLAYNEQRWNWLNLTNLTNLVEAIDDNGDLYPDERMSSGKSSYAIQLYFDIATKDIFVIIPYGPQYELQHGIQQINLSSEIRNSMLDLAQGKTLRHKRKAIKSRKARKAIKSRKRK
jgi:hypothetical protein